MTRFRGLRARLTIAFASAVFAAMLVFSGVVAAVVAFNEANEAKTAPATANDNADEGTESVERVLVAIALSSPVVLVGAVALGLWLARRALAPMREASERARAARSSELALTLPVIGSDDEWDELAKTMNGLLADARASMVRIRQFTGDAAHELKTPLTAIIGIAEVATRRDRSADEYRQALNEVREASVQLARLVDTLLMLSRADAGTLLNSTQPVDLTQLAREAIRRIETRRPGTMTVRAHLDAQTAMFQGDSLLLARVIDNLLENAWKHGAAPVDLAVQRVGQELKLEVRDGGPGVPEHFGPRMFERFSRADGARSGDGQGLGLAIARAIAVAHGGSLVFVRNEGQSCFRLALPSVAEKARLTEK